MVLPTLVVAAGSGYCGLAAEVGGAVVATASSSHGWQMVSRT